MAKILVVDDDERIRDFLSTVLEDAGHRVLDCESGMSALDVATAEQPELIILDVMMPRVDGFQVLWHLYSNMSTQHIPTIVLSSRTGAINRNYGLSLGARDYLPKPIELPSLLNSIDKAVAGGQTQAPGQQKLN